MAARWTSSGPSARRRARCQTQATLRDGEALALAPDNVLRRDMDMVERDLGVAVRRVVVAEERERALDRHARRVERDEDHRLLLVARRLRIGAAHHDRDLAARIACAGTPPLAPV